MALFLRFQDHKGFDRVSNDNQGNKMIGLCGFAVDSIEDAQYKAERYTKNNYYGHLYNHALVYQGEYKQSGNDGVIFEPTSIEEVIY